MWYCDVCKKHTNATKKVDIYKAPEYLILHLKRFKKTKDKSLIRFPLEGLDMTDYVVSSKDKVNSKTSDMGEEQKNNEKQKLIYDCYAINNHKESSNNSYTAYVKNFKDN